MASGSVDGQPAPRMINEYGEIVPCGPSKPLHPSKLRPLFFPTFQYKGDVKLHGVINSTGIPELDALLDDQLIPFFERDYVEARSPDCCLICYGREGHCTLSCPYLVLAVQLDIFKDTPPKTLSYSFYHSVVAWKESHRGRGRYILMGTVEENEANAVKLHEDGVHVVKVTCLPENVRKAKDLYKALGGFGCVASVVMFSDPRVAFVNFVSKEDAERVMREVSGYGHCMWALKMPE